MRILKHEIRNLIKTCKKVYFFAVCSYMTMLHTYLITYQHLHASLKAQHTNFPLFKIISHQLLVSAEPLHFKSCVSHNPRDIKLNLSDSFTFPKSFSFHCYFNSYDLSLYGFMASFLCSVSERLC